MEKWASIEHVAPKVGSDDKVSEPLLVRTANNDFIVAIFDVTNPKRPCFWSYHDGRDISNVTHWIEIPKFMI